MYCFANPLGEELRGKGQIEIEHGRGMHAILADVFNGARESDEDDLLDPGRQVGLSFMVDFLLPVAG